MRTFSIAIFLLGHAGCSLPPAAAKRPLTAVVVSDTGELLAAGSADGRVQIWDIPRDRIIREISAAEGSLNDLRFAPGGRDLAVVNRNLSLYSTRSAVPQNRLRQDGANYGTVRFSNDGGSILTINGSGEIAILNLRTGENTFRACCSTIYGEVAFADEDRKILSAGHWPSVWDRKSGALVARLTAARESMTFGPIAIGSGGTSVYMGSQDGRAYRWNLGSVKLAGTSPALTSYVTAMATQGTSPWIAYASRGESVRLWNTATGEARILKGARPSSNLWFDESRQSTAFGTASGGMEFWDLVGGRKILTLPIH